MKKKIAIITGLLMLFSLFSVGASAVQTEDGTAAMQDTFVSLVERIVSESALPMATVNVNSDGDDWTGADLLLMGDANLDDVVTTADARIVLRAAVGLEELTDTQIQAADMDQNGTITTADSRIILRMAVGLDVDEPDTPDEPDEPIVHTHSYTNYACSCGEVQDGQFANFLKEWIMDNYTVAELSQYHVQIAIYNDAGEVEYVVSIAYDTSVDEVMVGSAFVYYDYVWTTMIQLTKDATPGVGAIQVVDVETLESVSMGQFTVDGATYVAGDAFEMDEYDGYSEYLTYYEQLSGVGASVGLQVMHDYLTQECGYIFDYADVGFPVFANGLK